MLDLQKKKMQTSFRGGKKKANKLSSLAEKKDQ